MTPAQRSPDRRLAVVVTCLLLLAGSVSCAARPQPGAAPKEILVFSKTAGFRHASIPAGIATIQQLGRDDGVAVTATEDAGAFTVDNLRRFQAVVWLSTTGDVLDPVQQAAFETYVRDGGGYVGVHAAADTEYGWPWYGNLVGAWFADHPAIQEATVRVEDATNPATGHLGSSWIDTDEWYNFRTNPRPNVRVLLSADETSYSGGTMRGDHPITWCRDYDGGRSFYTALGHSDENWADTAFRQLVWGGIQIASGSVIADCRPTGTGAPSLTVALHAFANDRLVVAENAGAAPLIANRTAAGPWERFDVQFVGVDAITLRSRANGKYVCAEAAGGAPLIANRGAAGAWETFDLVHHDDGTVGLRARANGRYVVAENAGAAALIANRPAIGQWERFGLVAA
jgi:type 1 glutamine amidotransferase